MLRDQEVQSSNQINLLFIFVFFFKQTWDISMVFICLQFIRYIYSEVTLAKQICLLEILSLTLKITIM